VPFDLELTLPAAPEAVTELLDRLEAHVEAVDMSPALASRLCLVCEEMVSNIALHGAAAGATRILLSIRAEGEGLRVIIADDGGTFDPLAEAPPVPDGLLEDREVGGLGLHFLRQLASGLCYERRDGMNRFSFGLMPGARPGQTSARATDDLGN
jgi:serine/threonine-protein kinase RsbW